MEVDSQLHTLGYRPSIPAKVTGIRCLDAEGKKNKKKNLKNRDSVIDSTGRFLGMTGLLNYVPFQILSFIQFNLFLLFLRMVGIEPKVLYMVGKHSTTELHTPSFLTQLFINEYLLYAC